VEPGRRLIGSVPVMDVEIAFTGVPVTSLATGRDFFERLFGRPADVEVAVDEVMWRLAESAWLYVVVDAARAGQGLVALSVADLPATLAELAQRDIHPDRMEDVGGGRKATVLDPDGNTVAIISVPVERAAGARPRATG
jgi:catechol 2,3-dioxygenase-like lactoylglutathione lyase family enzyme